MRRHLLDHALVWREFRDNFQTTGAIFPSSPALGRALAHFIATAPPPRRILEAGPGTGAVTRQIIRALGPEDRLDLVEINPQFVARLRNQLDADPHFRSVRNRIRVIQQPVEAFQGQGGYEVIVSGLPLNNFPPELVQRVWEAFERLAAPRGVVSFFEYVGIRGLKGLVASAGERARLRAVEQVLARQLAGREILRQRVWANLPPAWVHHVRTGQAD